MRARVTLLLGCWAYLALVIASYVCLVSPLYAYMGYADEPAPLPYRCFAWALAALPALWMPGALTRPSQVVYWFLYLLVLVPGCVVPLYTYPQDPLGLLLFMFCMVLCFGALGLIYQLPPLRIAHLRLSRGMFWIGVAVLSGAFMAGIVAAYGVPTRLISLLEVYVVRSEFKATAAEQSRILGYVLQWQMNVFNPLLMAYGILRKNPLAIGLGVAGQLLIFSMTGLRSVLFSCCLIALLWLVLRVRNKSFGCKLTYGAVLLSALAFVEQAVAGSYWLCAYFLQRTVAAQGLVTGCYYEFFANHPKALLGQGILKGVIDTPYDRDVPQLIGTRYFELDTNANSHLWADGFANFGYGGMFLFTLVLALILWVYDSCTKDRDVRLAALLLGLPAITLCNAQLQTTVLTHGLGFLLLVGYFLPPGRSAGARAGCTS